MNHERQFQSAPQINSSFHLMDAVNLTKDLSDKDLSELGFAVATEVFNRAVNSGDWEALTKEGLEIGFSSRGYPEYPYIKNNILICPGGKVGTTKTNHKCRFVAIDGSWIWECSPLLDTMHTVGKHSTASITLFAATEGLSFTVIDSAANMQGHSRISTAAYVIKRGKIEAVR